MKTKNNIIVDVVLPYHIYNEVLINQGNSKFEINETRWHKAVYDAIEEFGLNIWEERDRFGVLKTDNPYVHSLEEYIQNSINLTGHLVQPNDMEFNTYMIREGHLDKIIKQQETELGKNQRLAAQWVAEYICDRI